MLKIFFAIADFFLKENGCIHLDIAKDFIKNNLLTRLEADKMISNISHEKLVSMVRRDDLLNSNFSKEYFIFKFRNTDGDTFEIFKFLENDMPMLIKLEMNDLFFQILDEIVDLLLYSDDLHWQYNASYLIYEKIYDILENVAKNSKDDVLAFLKNIFNKDDGNSSFEIFYDLYSKYDDLDKLFEDD